MKDKEYKLQQAERWCNATDKSTEFMLQHMQDYAGATLDEVIEYLKSTTPIPPAKQTEKGELR